jgi:WD40 repeat protein/predicted Ser/Thr protein kinase
VVRGQSPEVRGQKFGNYELLEKIGQGGMGVVYKARQLNLDRLVAVKLLPFGQFSREEVVQRFRAEAAAAAGLQHPNIVAIHDVGEQEGQQFFSMDFVEGHTLAELVQDQPLSAKRAAGYLKTIAEAVHFAHQHGILHRDLKPSNILIDLTDQPRITDFGLAKRLSQTTDHGPRTTDLTLSGQVLGSPNFMSPEQAGGAHAIGPAADIYSLGALLYHLLTRQPPFQGDTLTTLLKQVIETEPVPPRLLNPSIPRDLETICLKCLEKEVPRRYPSAQALAEDLGRFLEDKPIQARPVSAAGNAWKWCRRRPALAGMAIALLVTFVLGLAGVLWQWNRATRTAQAELQQRERAQASEYAADMHLAQLALADNNRPLAVSLLDKYCPTNSSLATRHLPLATDLRGWEWRYLWRLCQGDELLTLHRYSGSIKGLAVSKGMNLLAVAMQDEVALWDLNTRKPLTRLPIGGTAALAFSPTENLLAVGTRKARGQPAVDLWEVSGGKATKKFTLDVGNRSLSFSPDGKLLATFDDSGTFKIADWASRRTVAEFPVQPIRSGSAGFVVFSPEGNQVAIGEEYGRLSLYNIKAGTNLFLRTQTTSAISAIAFSPGSELLAAGFGYGEGTIRLWDARSGEPRGQLTKHTDDVTALAFAPDGEQLMSASGDGTIRIWSAADYTELRCLQSPREGLTALALLPDGKTLVSGSSGGALCLWDPTRSRPPAQTNLLVSSGLEALSKLQPSAFAPESLDPRAVRRFGVAFTPDSRRLITTDSGGTLAVWDGRSFEVVENLSAMGSNHWGVALSPDGHWLATGDSGGKITLWDWTTRRAVTNFPAHVEWFGLLRFSRRSHYIIAATVLNNMTVNIRVWRTGTWGEVPLTGGQFDALWSVDLSPDDRLLAAGYANGAVKLFRWPSLEYAATLTKDQGAVFGVLFSPDGRRLSSVGFDSTVRLWDVVARRELGKPLRGHLGLIGGAALLPDGRRLATGGSTARDAVKLWDLAAQRELLTLQGEGHYFMHVTCSPDGNTLAATSFTGVAHLWHAPSWEEIEAAERDKSAKEGATPATVPPTGFAHPEALASTQWLEEHLRDPAVRIVDARFGQSDSAFSSGHIPGAVPVAPLTDLRDTTKTNVVSGAAPRAIRIVDEPARHQQYQYRRGL